MDIHPSTTSSTFLSFTKSTDEDEQQNIPSAGESTVGLASDIFVPDTIEQAVQRMDRRKFRRRFRSRSGSLPDELDLSHGSPSLIREQLYGWVIVIAAFFISLIVDGVTYSFGTLYPEFLKVYEGGAVSTTLASSVLVGVTYGCGPLVSNLCSRYGLRPVAFIGAVVGCAGLVLSFVTAKIWQLVLTYGVVTGLGFGLLYLPAIVSVASWFDERRALATSIAVTGSGFGTIIFAPLTASLIETYTLHGALLIIGGIVLNGAVFASFLRKPPRLVTDGEAPETTPEKFQSPVENSSLSARMKRWLSDVDWKLFTNWKFCLYCISGFLGGISSYVPWAFLADRAEQEAGISKMDSAFLFSIAGIASIFGRLTSGICSWKHKLWIDEVTFYSLSCIVSGMATSFSVYCVDYRGFATYAVVFGYTGGIVVALQSVVLTELVGVSKISNAFGILLFVQGIATFGGPPLAGYFVDFHDYRLCFVIVGIVMSASGAVLILIPLIERIRNRSLKPEATPL